MGRESRSGIGCRKGMTMGSLSINNAGIAGWPGAVVMGNGIVSITVVPEAARILSMNYGGTELFFANREETGQVHGQDAAGEWHNFGGLRLDVAPQSGWKATPWGRVWPPPPILNMPRTLHRVGEGVVMKTAGDSANDLGLQIDAYVRLVEGSTIVAVDQTITNISGAPSRWANWAIAQLAASMGNPIARGNSAAFVPPAPDSKHGNGYAVQMEGPAYSNPIVVSSRDDPIKIRYNGAQWKFGFDRRNWMAFRPFEHSSLLFIMVGKYDPREAYPDDDSVVEYYAAAHMPYVELELLGPLVSLGAGAKRRDPFRFAVTNAMDPILDVTNVGVVTSRLELKDAALFGVYGVFFRGTACVVATSRDGSEKLLSTVTVTPDVPFELDGVGTGGVKYVKYRIDVYDLSRKLRGVLDILKNEGS